MNQPSRFLFVICQVGAEAALKAEFARDWPELRLSFSRPGFVTFKLPADDSIREDFEPHSVFARTYGFSLGNVSGPHADDLAQQAWELVENHEVDHLHCWQRDALVPGESGFEPGVTPLADEVARRLEAVKPANGGRRRLPVNRVPKSGQGVLDCVLVEPNEWWIGWHRAKTLPTRWPGGVPLLQPSETMINRAYLKMDEALRWSQLPVMSGDDCADIGSAPGGAAQLLLERGLNVLGIDPAEMDERVLAHPALTHVRKRAADVKRRELAHVRWLFADANVAPKHTLDTVEAIVTHEATRIRGMLLTLKLPDWKLAEEIPAYLDRVRSWGYRHIRARQLAFNRQEICVCAMKNRAMRRFKPQPRHHRAPRRAAGLDVPAD